MFIVLNFWVWMVFWKQSATYPHNWSLLLLMSATVVACRSFQAEWWNVTKLRRQWGNSFINFSWLRPGTYVFYGRSDSLEVSTSYILVCLFTVRWIPRFSSDAFQGMFSSQVEICSAFIQDFFNLFRCCSWLQHPNLLYLNRSWSHIKILSVSHVKIHLNFSKPFRAI